MANPHEAKSSEWINVSCWLSVCRAVASCCRFLPIRLQASAAACASTSPLASPTQKHQATSHKNHFKKVIKIAQINADQYMDLQI